VAESDVRALPIWKGAIRIEPLPGGLTNENWRVESHGRTYAVRTGADAPLLGISRANELACTRAAAELGLAPPIHWHAPGVLVSEFVAGTPLTPELAAQRIDRVAATLRAIHAAGAQVTGHLQHFCAFQVARTYVRAAVERGLSLPAGAAAEQLLAEVAALRARVAPFVPTFCHCDLMPANLLDDGERIWVIDWEYAGIGHPLFDVAGLASNCEFDAAQDRALLRAYFGRHDGAAHSQFRVLKAMAALRESLWAVLHGAQSRVEFDYAGYCESNWRKYRRYRDAVD
jgi:thiamine kinase-like enzyme